MQLNQNQRVNLGYWTYCLKAFKLKCKDEHLNYWSSLFHKGCYLTPFSFSLIKDIESSNLEKKIGLMYIIKKVCQTSPSKK